MPGCVREAKQPDRSRDEDVARSRTREGLPALRLGKAIIKGSHGKLLGEWVVPMGNWKSVVKEVEPKKQGSVWLLPDRF